MKISIITPDFSHNCFGRAWLLAKLLQNNFNIEVIGPAYGDGIWKPLDGMCDFKTQILKGYPDCHFDIRKMLKLISGDIIYASKPLFPSFGIALIYKFLTKKPVILDIDDYEPGFISDNFKNFLNSLIWPKRILDFIFSLKNYRNNYYTILLNKLIRHADEITVSGKSLKRIYGGTVIWHGRDGRKLDPWNYNKKALKNLYLDGNLEDKYVIGFIGTPRPFKGLEDLIKAIKWLNNPNFMLLIVGMDDNEYCHLLRKKMKSLLLSNSFKIYQPQPFNSLPHFLSISDLIVIPQRKRLASQFQMPAKLFDAMAMAKPIISTNVSDVPEILQNGGWIVDPEEPQQLASKIEYVYNHPKEAEYTGLKARSIFENKYSWNILSKKIYNIFNIYEKTHQNSVSH